MKEQTLIGLEIDGARVTVVESLAGMAVASRVVALDTLEDSLEVALSGIPNGKKGSVTVRAAVVCAGTTLRRMDVTAAVASSRAEFEKAVFELIPMAQDASAVAGVFHHPEALVGDAVSGGSVAAVPLTVVTQIYRAFGKRNVELVPSPLALEGHDGIWLGIHGTASEVTLVQDGRPVAFRQLRAGGLSAVAAVLADDGDPELGWLRVTNSLTAGQESDALADAELSRYLRMVSAELGQTLEFWRRNGEVIPENGDVIAYGMAGGAAGLATALAEVQLTRVLPEALVEQLTYIPPADREPSLLAWVCSATVGDQAPQVVLVNPGADELAAARKKARNKIIKIGAAGVVIAAVAGVLGVPLAAAQNDAVQASRARADAQAKVTPLLPVYHQTVDLAARQAAIDAAVVSEPQWSRVLKSVYMSRPDGSTVTRVTMSTREGALMVVVEGQKPGGTYGDLAGWLGRLMSDHGAKDAWTSGFSSTNGITSYEISFWLPPSQVPTARSLGDAASEATETPAGPPEAAPAPSASAPSAVASQSPASTAPEEPEPSAQGGQ